MNRELETNSWNLYDSIVQSYRSNMIASQALLLAVAAFIFEKNFYVELVVFIIGLIQLWYVWFGVIHARTLISDFHKFNSLYEFASFVDANGMLCDESCDNHMTEEIYVKNRQARIRANAVLAEKTGIAKLRRNMRQTRVKLDVIIPVTFTVLWVILMLFSGITFFGGM